MIPFYEFFFSNYYYIYDMKYIMAIILDNLMFTIIQYL